MKTTVEIPDSILKQTKTFAILKHRPVQIVVIEGIRDITAGRHGANPFELRKASFRGNGFQPGMDGASWPQIRFGAMAGTGKILGDIAGPGAKKSDWDAAGTRDRRKL